MIANPSSTGTTNGGIKVTLINAAGAIGCHLGYLLKINHGISHLALYDVFDVMEIASIFSHINAPARVTGHLSAEGLPEALCGASIVVVCARVLRKPGMTDDDMFYINAGNVRDIAREAARYCPKALFCVVTILVNSIVPVAAEVFKENGCFDPKRLMGITTLDVIRAQAFVSELKKSNALDALAVPVIGGHSGVTIVPLLSKVQPSVNFSDEELKALTLRMQQAGREVVDGEAGARAAISLMAFAAERFLNLLIRAMRGEPEIQTCAYVASNACPGVDYFAVPVELGPDGVELLPFDISSFTSYERELIAKAIPELKSEIAKGEKFIRQGM